MARCAHFSGSVPSPTPLPFAALAFFGVTALPAGVAARDVAVATEPPADSLGGGASKRFRMPRTLPEGAGPALN